MEEENKNINKEENKQEEQSPKECKCKLIGRKILAALEKILPKRYRTLAIVGYVCALLLIVATVVGIIIGLNHSNPEDEPKNPVAPILHYAVENGVTEATMKEDISKILSVPEGTALTVEGTYDLATPGKYTLTCKWETADKKQIQTEGQRVEVWVYDNSFAVTIDGKPYDGNTVYLNFQKAVASENFVNCIKFIDSIGNEMKVTKEADRSMSFTGKEGTYWVHYNPTDAVGHQFPLRVEYVVVFDCQISVSNAFALTYEETAEIPVDFDGATGVWLEDETGKLNTEYYEIKENSLVLKKAYYASQTGRKIRLKVCSEYGNADFYLSVFDEAGYEDYLNRKVINILRYNAASVIFRKVTGGVDDVQFRHGYLYTKSDDISADAGQLTLNNAGKYGKVSFDLYVKSATGGASGNGVMEFQITDGARFISVKDTEGNSVSVIDKNDMPHVLLDAGKVYHIELDLSEAMNPGFRVWGAKAVEVYYYHFNAEESTYEYVIDDVTKSIICKKNGEEYGYFAWPTVTKLDGDRLIAVSSGFRQAHIDPAGKVAAWFSEDGGKTWSEPKILADTLLDDRDSGVVYWNGKIIVSWFCASKVYYLNNNANKYSQWAATIDDAYDTKYMGGNYIISEDGGKTWSEIYNMPDGMFTPHGLIVNPDGGLTSVGYLKYDKEHKTWGTGIGVRTTTGEMDENGFIWSDAIVIATDKEQNETTGWDFQEPYGIYNDDGVLIVVMRSNKGLYQCELQPGETKFSDWHLIARVQETPAHMIQHSSGVMIMTYGYRGLYKDVNGNTISYTERNKDTTLGIRARLSYDGGLTWTREVILTYGLKPVDNSSDWGYTSTVELPDGKLLTVYYQRTSGESKASIYQAVWSLPEAPVGEKTITFYTGDGSKIESISGQVGETITAPQDPTLAGHAFGGWYLDSACSIPFTFTTFSKDLTLYAKWIAS